jgi:SAM-dependent methyltransferase
MKDLINKIFSESLLIEGNLILKNSNFVAANQAQTNAVFSDKWLKVDDQNGVDTLEEFQRNWYLELYGFKDFNDLSSYLSKCEVILDAGCGLGYKAAWFAQMAPNALVIGMDYSEAVLRAAINYRDIPNLFFIRGDIADTRLKPETIDYISCDQVLHHTENPELTFEHLAQTTKKEGEFACYVYAKKALPRELVDDYFRQYCKQLSKDDLWKLSEQLTELGRRLSDLQISFDCPNIPALGIVGGQIDIQRFVYWNFLKCFWNTEFGWDNSVATNFDWYAPSNAKRYSEQEFRELILTNELEIIHFHKEEACYSGRFRKQCAV